MTTRPMLFGSLQSGHSYKVRLALLLLGIEHGYRAIDLSPPRADRDPDAVAQWLFWDANRIGLSLPNYRLCRRFGADVPVDVANWLHARMTADLAALDAALAGGAYLLGRNISAADIACSAYLSYRDVPGLDLDDYPAISDWLARIAALPGWRAPHKVMGLSTA